MAELINKKEAIEQIKSIPYATQEEVFFMHTAVSRMRKMPTTTEAEIRAKAQRDIAEWFWMRRFSFTSVQDMLDKYAEQLKGK